MNKIAILVALIGLAAASRPAPYYGCFLALDGVVNSSVQNQTYVYEDLFRNRKAIDVFIKNVTNLNTTCADYFKKLNEHRRSGVHLDSTWEATNRLNYTATLLRTKISELIENGPSDFRNYYSIQIRDIRENISKLLDKLSRSVYYRYVYEENPVCEKLIKESGAGNIDKSTSSKYLDSIYEIVRGCETLWYVGGNPRWLRTNN
eukprot:TRINITY_DN1110_c0_g1_i3.p1 TRINITY_DN1110_c0_g1~~TRINITY_DN1110_c0_g1_i3.p1  ORF type:complete len:204 (+),score=40.20 TRINITY_DN1110_c0_g1_i3:127-738(+)